ncbi:MAG: CotH kinase family protein, partial [Ferruginibacter sp.]|nr:CotH kinase family protein [Cytophagales bacterium]
LDAQASRPVLVFLNGEYWGIHHAQERLDPHYLAGNHGVDEGVDFLEMDRNVVEGDAAHYQRMIDFIGSGDMRVPANFDTVAKWMDVDEFIHYQAAQIYAANVDWPGNNLDYWRSRTPNGKWRWIFYDLDFGFGLAANSGFDRDMLSYATDPNGPTFPTPAAANSPYGTFLLRSLLENESFKYRFINRFADLLNTHFKTERVLQKLEEARAALAPAMPEHVARWRAPTSVSAWESHLDGLRTFAQQRPTYQRQHLAAYFRLDGTAQVTLDVSDPARGRVQINALTIDATTPGAGSMPYPWQGVYFKNVPVRLTALPQPGFRFAGWQVAAPSGVTLPPEPSIQLALEEDVSVTALFEPEPANPPLAMPTPFDLAGGSYALTEWKASQPATTYPAHLTFERTAEQDPTASSNPTANYRGAYHLTAGTRINGLGTDGFSFVNTDTDGNLGAAVLALNTTGRTNVRVHWTGGTVVPNARVYAIRLQYRVGNGAWTNVPGALEYRRNAAAGHAQKFVLDLSSATANAVDNRPVVYLRWQYYFVSGSSGDRAQLRVGDLLVSSTALAVAPTRLAIVSVNGNRPPSRDAAFAVVIESRDEAGNPQRATTPTDFTVSLASGGGRLTGTLAGTIPAGQATATLMLRYDRAETDVQLAAVRDAGDNLLAGTGAPFAVLEAAAKLVFVDSYPYGAAGTPYRTFLVAAKRPDNSLDRNFTGSVTVAPVPGVAASGTVPGADPVSGTLTRSCVAGVAQFDSLVFSAGGVYTLSAGTPGLTGATTGPIKIAGMTEVLVPRFVQGKNGINAGRVPFAFRVAFNNLNANARYRYFNQMVSPLDAITANGSGNVVFTNAPESRRTADVSTNQPGQYGEFTTDGNGAYAGWFVTEPTGNNRFTPGKELRVRLVLNDGGGGSDPFFRLTGRSLVRVVNFGSDANGGTALVGNSCAAARNVVVLYDQTDGGNRPVAATVAEDDGVDNSLATNYASFYAERVNGQAGAWGVLLPNGLPQGIRRIEQHSLADGHVIGFGISADGHWGGVSTVNPGGGATLVIPAAAASLASAPVITQEGAELVSSAAGSNQWYREDGPVPGATGPRHAPTQSGRYRVLADGPACPTNFSAPFDFLLTALPANPVGPDQTLRVFPNPTTGKVRISFQIPFPAPTAERVELRLINLMGQEVHRQPLDGQGGNYDLELDLSGDPSGLYLLQLRYGEQTIARKLLLQR